MKAAWYGRVPLRATSCFPFSTISSSSPFSNSLGKGFVEDQIAYISISAISSKAFLMSPECPDRGRVKNCFWNFKLETSKKIFPRANSEETLWKCTTLITTGILLPLASVPAVQVWSDVSYPCVKWAWWALNSAPHNGESIFMLISITVCLASQKGTDKP